jgi:hypothetical protein
MIADCGKAGGELGKVRQIKEIGKMGIRSQKPKAF